MTVRDSSSSRMPQKKLLLRNAFGLRSHFMSMLNTKTALSRVVWIALGATPFLVASLVWGSSSPSCPDAVSFKSDFEDGNYSEWRAGELHTPWAIQIVNGVGDNKTKVARFEYRNTDVQKYDTEKADLAGPFVPMGADQWYAFDFYLPSSFEIAQRAVIIFQNHAAVKRTGVDFGGRPPISLSVRKNNNGIDSLFFAAKYTEDRRITEDIIKIREELGPVAKDTWQKVLLHVKWLPNNDGRVELYLNGDLKYSRSGIIGYKDTSGKYLGPYPRIGFYMPNNKGIVESYAGNSVIYFDNFRMGCRSL